MRPMLSWCNVQQFSVKQSEGNCLMVRFFATWIVVRALDIIEKGLLAVSRKSLLNI